MIFGVDLGSRTVHLVGINQYGFGLRFKIEAQIGTRWNELGQISSQINERVLWDDTVFVEEPPYVNNRRTFLALGQTCGAVLAACQAPTYVVPVAKWKQEVVGKGSAGKPVVAAWLSAHHPDIYAATAHDQNFVDAACIALYGKAVLDGMGVS